MMPFTMACSSIGRCFYFGLDISGYQSGHGAFAEARDSHDSTPQCCLTHGYCPSSTHRGIFSRSCAPRILSDLQGRQGYSHARGKLESLPSMYGFQPHDCVHGYSLDSYAPGRVRRTSSQADACRIARSICARYQKEPFDTLPGFLYVLVLDTNVRKRKIKYIDSIERTYCTTRELIN